MTASPLDRLKWAAAVTQDPELTAGAKILSPVLAYMANAKTGKCSPSVGRLAKLTGQGPRAVQLGLGALRDRGWLSYKAGPGGYARSSCNTYTLNFDKLTAYDPWAPLNVRSEVPLNDGAGVPLNEHSQTPAQNSARPLNERSPEQGLEQGLEQGGRPTGFAVPPLRADGGPEEKDSDSENDNPILSWLRSDESGAVMRMGRQDLTQEWIDATKGMSLAEAKATRAKVRGSCTPLHFKDALGRAPKPAAGDGAPCVSVRGWLKAQTGLASVYVKDANLFRLIQIYGPDTMLALARHAHESGGLDKELLCFWYKGRKSSYGGWDYYVPKAPLPEEMSEDAVREIVCGVPV